MVTWQKYCEVDYQRGTPGRRGKGALRRLRTMPQLSWKEIRERAVEFSKDWEDAENERAESQTFWNEFFAVFGIKRRTVASFEEPIKNIRGKYSRIDLFWRGTLLVEHKSKGKRLDSAASQAFQYIQDLARGGRDDEIPRYVIVSDFSRFALYDLEAEDQKDKTKPVLKFKLENLYRHVRSFGFIRGERVIRPKPEDPANEKAYRLMCHLHDELRDGGFENHDLEKLLVRILFCLFAEDTGIFEPNAFLSYIQTSTRKDGTDLGAKLNEFFEVLNTPTKRRQANLPEELASLPYVNGQLFAERTGFASFTHTMRNSLIEAAQFHWARISPAVFGSLFQGVMEEDERRQLGAHYTSERDIMRVIDSLFLKKLRIKFENIKADRSSRRLKQLEVFQKHLRSLRFLDPACGCGNFLIIAYRELRALEHEVLHERQSDKRTSQRVLELRTAIQVDIDQFYGIEILEWPAKIAEVAMWLMDHQMNQEASALFGKGFDRLPLKSSPRIICGNALRMDWADLGSDFDYILGNPPFVGMALETDEQKEDHKYVFNQQRFKGLRTGRLDYVACWYIRAFAYAKDRNTMCAFVSTNSLVQGEQARTMGPLLEKFGFKINFAHCSFKWISEAKGKAQVTVVIIGFSSDSDETSTKPIFQYPDPHKDSVETHAKTINWYLADGPSVYPSKRTEPFLPILPKATQGSKPWDGGGLLITQKELDEVLRDPIASKYVRPFFQTTEMLYNRQRWCLWLKDAPAHDLHNSEILKDRLRIVAETRRSCSTTAVQRQANTPSLFSQDRQPEKKYLALPEVSSENRRYIPGRYFGRNMIAGNKLITIEGAPIWLFGILQSAMFMAWVRTVVGRLESRYSLAPDLAYNAFPFPSLQREQIKQVGTAAQAVLDARNADPNSSLDDLYGETSMPVTLLRAHQVLDRAVDACYTKKRMKFSGDSERLRVLLARYISLENKEG